ncbi:hypothetical protein DMH04_37695 [Kibdelosporangium aridum]|uniref:Uncharacterized protein n=1 Tax=Kibdelosporangium aridum TaxID=2030 RepID=A0A428YYT0_KIBAR|nr:hypothetical protein [Kibdelosporangium aridum]RSM75866.1 hypothetical protein DMH04_37695 [Kibdelosporangium aridum]
MAFFVALAGFLTAACGTDGGEKLTKDENLSKQLADLRQKGGSVLLRDLTGGDWDKVYISPEPASRDLVEKEVGAKVDMEDVFIQRGNILVFMKDGAVQRATFITPNLLRDGTYGADVKLEAAGGTALIKVSSSN